MIYKVRSHKTEAKRVTYKVHDSDPDSLSNQFTVTPTEHQSFGITWKMDGRSFLLLIDPKEAGRLRDRLTDAMTKWGEAQEQERGMR